MAIGRHKHEVYDSDHHFVIDPVTREVANANSKKTLIMQYDHSSEIFTFELDRTVEGHDMTLCNEIQVHFNNVDASKRFKNSGVYEVKDLQVSAGDENKVVFSWTLSDQCTLYAGTLNFLITFACVEDGEVTYRWNTGINTTITVASGINNTGEIAETFPDILAQWKDEIFSTNLAYKAAVEHGFEGTEEEWLNSLKGSSGIYVGEIEPSTTPYFWFDTSENRMIHTIFDLADGEDSTTYIDTEDQEIVIANVTVNEEVTSKNQYNFVITE